MTYTSCMNRIYINSTICCQQMDQIEFQLLFIFVFIFVIAISIFWKQTLFFFSVIGRRNIDVRLFVEYRHPTLATMFSDEMESISLSPHSITDILEHPPLPHPLFLNWLYTCKSFECEFYGCIYLSEQWCKVKLHYHVYNKYERVPSYIASNNVDIASTYALCPIVYKIYTLENYTTLHDKESDNVFLYHRDVLL